MKRTVWRIDRAGSLDRLTRRDEELPPPGAGEARVCVKTVGLNFADVFACLGLYSATPRGSFVPGLEFAGTVEALGPPAGAAAAPDVRPGERVFGMTRFGAYASALNAPARLLRRMPEGWSPAEAAAFPVQGLTAWYGLVDLARVEAGEIVLLQSAAGGVGLLALAILRSIGAIPICIVGREGKRWFLIDRRGVAPDLVIVRDRRRFGDQIDAALAAANADGLDVVFDAVAGPYLQPAFQRLRPRGRLVVYGAADFMPRGRGRADPRLLLKYFRRTTIDPLALMTDNRSVMGFNLIWLWSQAHRLPEALASLERLCPDPPLVGRRFPFGEAPAAMEWLKSGESVGKVVLET